MIDFELLANAVKEVTGTSKEELISKKRPRPIVELRMICSSILSERHSSESLKVRGSYLNIDHSTVLHHLKTHENLLREKDGNYKRKYEKIKEIYSRDLLLASNGTRVELLEKRKQLQDMIEEIDYVLSNIKEPSEYELIA
jgi:hypothetical protein